MGGVVSKRVFLAVAVLAFAAVGCGGGDDSKTAASPKASASQGRSGDAAKCFSEVIKALDLTFNAALGKPSGVETEEQFAAFGVKADGTPMWDVYKEHADLGARELAQGVHTTAVDAIAAYAPSIKLECTQQYG
jgi:hypothetical protein